MITLLSVGLSLFITIVYRVLTNPDEVRKMKDDMKFYKEKMNDAKKSGDKAKMNEYANEMLKASQGQFKMSMKPMMVTMLVFMVLLGWINTNFGGVIADFGDEDAFFIYGDVEHLLTYEGNAEDFVTGVDFNDDKMFTDDEMFQKGDIFEYKETFWRPIAKSEGFYFLATEQDDSVHFEMLIAKLPFTLPFIGNYVTWFWWYMFISLPATFVLRKVMGVE